MKKLVSLLLVAAMLISTVVMFASCSDPSKKEEGTTAGEAKPVAKDDFKLGVILLHSEDSTYDNNFIEGIKSAAKEMGLKDNQVIFKRNIPESNACYEAACDLVDEGCDLIFADSFGHESHMIKAAKEFPNVQFCHATGTQAHVEKLANYHNAFASIYEGRYLAGIAAGLKLNQMIADGKITADKAKIGYVGAFTYAEVISGYTSFFLGARSVCPSVTMDVQFTGSWYDETAEKNTATSLIQGGCVLISQHADSMGAPTACEEAGVPNVSYNGSTVEHCPNTYIVSSRINWAPYIKYISESVINGKAIDTDWCGTIATGSVVLTEINEKAAAPETAAKIEEAKKALTEGKLHIFDTEKFTVKGEKVTSYKVEETVEVIKDGYFDESGFRAAPYFDLKIDGITLLNENFG